MLPADAILGIEGGRLTIRRNSRNRRERKPIDIFLAALAADQGERAVGIILSGGDSDGTLGVKAIKERGGLTLAQIGDGFGPQYPDMPESAISGGYIDFAVPADRMGGQIAAYVAGLGRADALAEAAADDPAGEPLDAARDEICGLLRNQTGHEFGGYKARTFLRRVQRRMQINQDDSPEAYLERLRQNPQEVAALFRDLLINVTNFFRDAEAFQALADRVIPELFRGRGADDVVRIWVPGCATGEEVFSIGILVREQMERLPDAPRVQIFATDIDERAIGVARTARYPAPLLDSVTPERRERWFVADGGSYVVSKEVRDLCIFSPHSVIRDPPFSRVDLISCRNLLIYFGADMQGEVIPTFHYALRPDGYLFLGTAENISQFQDLFTPVEKRHRIFRRRADGAAPPRLPVALARLRPGGPLHGLAPRRTSAATGLALRQTVEGQVLEHFSPAFVVVNREGEAVHFSARTGKYLEAAPGAPSRQVVTMARKGLRLDLRAALREAVETGRRVVREGVGVEGDDGRVQVITLTVEPMSEQDGGEPLYLILFADQGPAISREEALKRLVTHDGATLELDRELRETRERLQSMIEEYETALEEVKSANEELVSVNEELQSTNEELEASKEELQSVNEELHTLNAELQNKVEALDRANSDLRNLFESTDAATIFLDRDLTIRGFTPAVARVFNILPGDRGRPITDLSSRLHLPEFARDLGTVLAGGAAIERRVEDQEGGAHYLLRLNPYRDIDQRQRGVVVSFVDVTGLTHAEQRQRVLIAELHHRTRNLLSVVQALAALTLDKGGTVKSFTERLAALSRAQDLLNNTGRHELDLATVVRRELDAHGAAPDGVRVVIAGPTVRLTSARVQALALAVHELGTNATKYGALKHPGARLEVRWSIEPGAEDAAPRCLIEWRETGVPMPDTPPRRGHGRQLIERALRLTLGTKAELGFGPDGIVCRIEMPLDGAAEDSPEADAAG